MTPPSNEQKQDKRITVNLDQIDYKIVETLEGVIGNSKSSVIYQMVKEWINQNSERIMKTWDIDLVGIRRQVISELKGLSIQEEMKDLEKDIIKQLPALFETINNIEPEELASILEINAQTLKKVILMHRKELLDLGLNLKYEDGKILKQ
jgi:hypothetical protein